MREKKGVKTGKILGKCFMISGKTLGGVFLLVYILIALLNSTLVQSFTAAKTAEYFSKEWKTKVSIGALEIRPLFTVSLKDVYLETPEGDTIGDIAYLRASLRSFSPPSTVRVSSVTLRDAKYVVATENHKINLAFIIDYFKSDKPKKDKPKKAPFVLKVDKLRMHNVNFHLDLNDNPAPIPEFGVAINHMNFRQINALIEDIEVIGDSIVANFRHFSTTERSGQEIKDLSGGFIVSPRGIRCHNMNLKTADSHLKMQAEIHTTSWKTYSHFLDSAYCKLALGKSSYASMKDATYWAPMLKGFDQTFDIYTKIEGTVADAKCEFMNVVTSQTSFLLSGSVKGLPNIDNTVFDVTLWDLETSAEDFNGFEMGEMLSMVKLPQMLYGLGTVRMNATFKGLIDKFSAEADIVTDIGALDLTASAEDYAQTERTSYKCQLESKRFKLGSLFGGELLGTSGLEISAMAVPSGLNELVAQASCNFDNFVLNGNNYNSIVLDAKMANGDIEADCDIFDDAIVMNLNCKGNLRKNQRLSLSADITDANLKKINFFHFADTSTEISTRLYASIRNFNLDSINGFADLQDTKIRTSDTIYDIEYFNLRIRNEQSGNQILLKSDLAEAEVKGEYQIMDLAKEIGLLIDRYEPDLYLLSSSSTALTKADTLKLFPEINSVVDFSLSVKNIDPIAELFKLDMALKNGAELRGKINPKDIFSVEFFSSEFSLSDMVFDRINLSCEANQKGVELMTGLDKLKISDSFAIVTPRVSVKLGENELGLLATFGDNSKEAIGGHLDLKTYLTNTGLQASFDNSYIMLAGDRIGFNDNHLINYQDGRLSLMNFSLIKGKENIVINGDASDKKEDKLTVSFKNLNIADFNPILSKMGLELQGELNDKVVIRSVFKQPTLTSDVSIKNLAINSVALGDAKINLNNTLSQREFAANISMTYSPKNAKQRIPLEIEGIINPYDKEDNLDLKISMEDLDIRLIENYLSSFTSYLRGSISTKDLAVKGKFSQPHILGSLVLKNSAIKIDMLNTVYSFDNELRVENNVISLKNFTLQDIQKNKITLEGSITHKNFTDFDLDLSAVADKIKILDTEETIDQMYYGTAYASANATLRGNLDFLNIEVSARTERGTSLTVPISSKISANESSYITFAQPSENIVATRRPQSQSETSSMGYHVVVDLNVNPNAEILIPLNFNQLKGDLSAAGNGELRIEVGSESDVAIYGTVEVDNGIFKMSLVDMMTKSFEIEKGGTLSWSGAPADGVIDLQAIYKTKASLAPVLGQEYSKSVDVQSVILLSGNMTNPQPKFDIRLPNTDATTVERLFMNIDRNDEKAMLEQTVSLLFLHQFYSSEGAAENSFVETGLSSAFEAAFGQISGMLTDLIQVVDVDMNYSRGMDGTSDRVDFNLSKDYGRIVVNANAGFSGRNETDATQTNAILGDAYIEYKMTNDFRLRAFNRSNADDFTKYNITPYTQGVGLFYQRQYDRFKDIFIRKKKQENKDTK